MATKMVSTTVFFPVKKLFLQNENLNKFRTCLLIFSILFKFSAGFFSYFSLTRLVNMGIICICSCMFHNFYLSVFYLSVLSVFLLVCISTGKPSRQHSPKFKNGILRKCIETPERRQCFLMYSCQWGQSGVFLLTLNRLHTLF